MWIYIFSKPLEVNGVTDVEEQSEPIVAAKTNGLVTFNLYISN